MNPLEKARLLPHEIAFSAFLASAWIRLVFAQGVIGGQSLLYLVMIVVNAAAILWCRRRESTVRWRIRLVVYPILMNVIFFGMGAAVGAMNPGKEDALLERIDQALVGTTPCLALESLVVPSLTEILSLCYLLFFPYLTFSMIYYFCGDLKTLKKFFAGLFTIYGLGFIGYSLLPASGPYVAMAGRFTVPLEGGWITALNQQVVLKGSNGVDVFPSLHCALSCYILFFDFTHRRWRFLVYALPCAGLWISTIYLRYHYLVDVLVGFALSAGCLWMVSRWGARKEPRDPAPVV